MGLYSWPRCRSLRWRWRPWTILHAAASYGEEYIIIIMRHFCKPVQATLCGTSFIVFDLEDVLSSSCHRPNFWHTTTTTTVDDAAANGPLFVGGHEPSRFLSPLHLMRLTGSVHINIQCANWVPICLHYVIITLLACYRKVIALNSWVFD